MTDLSEKTMKYEKHLHEALESIQTNSETKEAEEFLEMAQSYYKDGNHFLKENDEVNALAAFAYGHAWLDAGIRLNYYDTDKEELFTI